MKKYFAMVLSLILILALNVSIFADGNSQHVVDNANLLSGSECSKLESKLDEISQKHKVDVAIVTVDSLDGRDVETYTDDFFWYNGYGIGDQRDGIMLLVAMDSRDTHISTHGFGITAFTDAGQDHIWNCIIPYLSSGDYAKAFNKFADLSDDFIQKALDGHPYDRGNMPKGSFPAAVYAGIASVIGLIWGAISNGRLKGQLKSVVAKQSAQDYIVPGSFNLTTERDLYLYKNVTSERIQTQSSSSRSSGSSTHMHSSGTSFGGSSRKF